MDLPWKTGETPYYTDPSTGTQWWVDKFSTEHARRDLPQVGAKGLMNVAVFFVKTEDHVTRLAIDDEQNVLIEDTTLEGMGTKLDFLKIARSK